MDHGQKFQMVITWYYMWLLSSCRKRTEIELSTLSPRAQQTGNSPRLHHHPTSWPTRPTHPTHPMPWRYSFTFIYKIKEISQPSDLSYKSRSEVRIASKPQWIPVATGFQSAQSQNCRTHWADTGEHLHQQDHWCLKLSETLEWFWGADGSFTLQCIVINAVLFFPAESRGRPAINRFLGY